MSYETETEALEAAFEELSERAGALYPHKNLIPQREDPVGFDIVPDPSGNPGEAIVATGGTVELHAVRNVLALGARTRWRYEVATVCVDDVSVERFPTPGEAARWFLLEQFRVRLGMEPLASKVRPDFLTQALNEGDGVYRP